MRRAKAFAKTQHIDVELMATHYAEDSVLVPTFIKKLPLLERSVKDIQTFNIPRKLPLIQDILLKGYQHSNADYLIYTNVDIALLPHFYTSVAAFIEQGCDALVINRRTISQTYSRVEDIMCMYAEVGKKHPGYDCFVFRRELVPSMLLKEICIGATAIGLVMIANLLKKSNAFVLLENVHLTFHIGDDRRWNTNKYDDYRKHNEGLAKEILETLEETYGAFSPDDPGWAYEYLERIRNPKTQKTDNQLKVPRKLTLWEKVKWRIHKWSEI